MNLNLNETLVEKLVLQSVGEKNFLMRIPKPPHWINVFLGQGKFFLKNMNEDTRQIYFKLYNICFFQDFVSLNIRWLCYCLDKSKENFKKCLMKFYTAVQMKKIENIKFCWRVSGELFHTCYFKGA